MSRFKGNAGPVPRIPTPTTESPSKGAPYLLCLFYLPPFVLWALAVIQPALFQRGSHRIAQIRHVRVWIRALEGVTGGSVSPSAASFAPDRGLLVIDQLGLHTLHGNTRRGRRVALQPDYL